MDTSNIQPTLTDSEVLDFCKNGYLLLDGVVPDEINRRAVDFLDNDTYFEPTTILAEDWFMEGVILNPAAGGAIRSLLGGGVHHARAHEQPPRPHAPRGATLAP